MLRSWALVLPLCVACAPATTRAPVAKAAPQPSTAASPDAAAPAAISCSVQIEALGKGVVGAANGGKDDDVVAIAKQHACDKLRAEAQLDCKDTARVTSSTVNSIKIEDGKVSKWAQTTLSPVVATLHGAGQGESFKAACTTAANVACRGAPSGSSCSASSVACRKSSERSYDCHPIRLLSSLSGETQFAPSPFGN